jgi:hypothetical protein
MINATEIYEDQDGHNLMPQTVENQLQTLQEAAGRLGWSVVSITRTWTSVAPRTVTAGLD